MTGKFALLSVAVFSSLATAKVFQNSYVSFEVPDNWTCAQEGVAWTCNPQAPVASKEAVIVLAAKVAGPEDNLTNFQNYLAQPKKIPTKVGTPMPSKVGYAQARQLAGMSWIQSQHLGSEIQDYYTLYLATVKEQLAILISFSTEKSKYQVYNPIFDRAVKTLKITASQQLLFPKTKNGAGGEVIGINVPIGGVEADLMPPPERRPAKSNIIYYILIVLIGAGIGFAFTKMGPTKKKRKK